MSKLPSLACIFLVALLAAVAGPARAQDLTGAVIVQYHRFGEDQIPATSIRLDQFEAHVAELASGRYTVLPLPDIVAAMRDGKPLADRTVAITVDDPFLSVYAEAWPRLRAAQLPFTLFVLTDVLDGGRGRGYMTWDQVTEMAAAGVTIGVAAATAAHLPALAPPAIAADLARARQSFATHLGHAPTLFAYPFGEMSLPARDAVASAGYVAAFGQHSGVAEAGLDRFFLPRFAFNEQYGDLARFVMAVNALPFGARDVTPEDPVLGENPPTLAFTLAPEVLGTDRMNCFASNDPTPPDIVPVGGRRIEVRPKAAFAPGRGRVSCTLPAGQGRFRWFGTQFFIPAP